MKNYVLDSSDEESEKAILRKGDIVNKLKQELFNFQTPNDFSLHLALIIHFLSDRVFGNSDIDAYYQRFKLAITGVSKSAFDQIIDNIRTAVNNIFKIQDLPFQDYKKCFNYIFNSDDIQLPQDINKAITIRQSENKDFNFAQELLMELKKLQPDLAQLSQNPLLLEVSKESTSGAELLSFSKIVSRNNKNIIKNYKLKDIETNVINISYKLPVNILEALSEHHVVKNNGNTSAHIPNMGTYTDILKDSFFKKYKTEIINNIFAIIRNEKKSVINNNDNYIDEKLTHLMFVTEMVRNNATLFTAPIFLELIQKEQKIDFPMSKDGATSDSRGINKHYKELLPKHHKMDYDIPNVSSKTDTQKFLTLEGRLIMEWLKCIDKNFVDLFKKMEMFPSLIVINSKKLNQISVNDIIEVSDFLKTTEYPLNLEQNTIDSIKHIVEFSLQDARTGIVINKNKEFLDTKLEKALAQNEKGNKIICDILKELQKLINKLYEEYDKTKSQVDNYVKTINIGHEVKTVLPDIVKYLSCGLKQWYNIDCDLKMLFNLEESENQKKESGFDKNKILKEEGIDNIHVKKLLPIAKSFNEDFKQGMEQGKLEGQLKMAKMLLKKDIQKLQKHFKQKGEEELDKHETFLSKKRYLKQLDKEQKWGNTVEEKFEFITKHIKTHLEDKYDKISNDLGLVGNSMDLENISDCDEWSSI